MFNEGDGPRDCLTIERRSGNHSRTACRPPDPERSSLLVCAFVRADMDNGLRGSPHSRERGEPRLHDTLGLSDLLPSSEVGQQQKKLIPNTVPLGRFGTPDEIAKAVVSRIGRITGIELFVDGGVTQV